MEDLRKLFETMINVVRVDLEGDSFYLAVDSDEMCYLIPSRVVGLFPNGKRPWKDYGISVKVFIYLAFEVGSEWVKREGKWL